MMITKIGASNLSMLLLLIFSSFFFCEQASADDHASTLVYVMKLQKQMADFASTHNEDFSKSYRSLISTVSTRQTGSSSGPLGGETCLASNPCSRGQCIRLVQNGVTVCKRDRFDCLCELVTCKGDGDCLSGETCDLLLEGQKSRVCKSKNMQKSRVQIREGGKTLAQCRTGADCASTRDCFALENNLYKLCSPNIEFCACHPLVVSRCSNVGSSKGCPKGEICHSVGTSSICIATATSELLNSSGSGSSRMLTTKDRIPNFYQQYSVGIAISNLK